MFSGIIETTGIVEKIIDKPDAKELVIKTELQGIKPGDSVAVNGVCLTATHQSSPRHLVFFVSSETLNRTSLKFLKGQAKVNLERAVSASTALSGHIVQGHVDNMARIVMINHEGDGHEMRVAFPSFYQRYMVEKGSIALDGISLTINHIHKASSEEEPCKASFMIIPHTWEHTSLNTLERGAFINFEVDVIAKYIEAQLNPWRKSGEGQER